MEAIGASGLAIDGLFGTHRIRGLGCATDPAQLDGPYAAVFMTVKAYDTAAMAAAVVPHLARDGFLLSLQNGLGNVEAAERAVGAARVLGARVIFGSELVAPGHARVTVYADPVLIGSPAPTDTRRRTAAHRASMLQDIEHGRPTEIDAINGQVAARGAAHGVPTPVNATLARLIRARTRVGRPREDSRWSA